MYDAIRADAATEAARADAAQAQRALIRHVCDQIAKFEKRFDALEARLAEAEDKRRADETAARAFDEEPLSEPPGTVEDASMNKVSAREIIARDETHTAGEFSRTGLDPEGDLPEPPLSTADVELHPTDPALEDPLATDLPDDPPKGKVVPQPISISLNEG